MSYELKKSASEKVLDAFNSHEDLSIFGIFHQVIDTSAEPWGTNGDDADLLIDWMNASIAARKGETVVNPINLNRGDVVFGKETMCGKMESFVVTDESDKGFGDGTIQLDIAKMLIKDQQYRVIGNVKLPRVY